MPAKSIEDVELLFHIHKEYITQKDNQYGIGWVQANVSRFEINEESNELEMILRMPWGEEHAVCFDLDNLWYSGLSTITNNFGYNLEEFRNLESEKIWIKLKELDVEDGDIVTDIDLHIGKCKYGKETEMIEFKNELKKVCYYTIVLVIMLISVYIGVLSIASVF